MDFLSSSIKLEDYIIVDYGNSSVLDAEDVNKFVPYPVHEGFRCIAAFSPCTNGWVGSPYIWINPSSTIEQDGGVQIYFDNSTMPVGSGYLSCAFLYIKI